MGVDHLIGRRTGRPKGVRSTPSWSRDVVWAYRHLGEADAVAPTALAGQLVALGREHPDRLATLLLQLDGQGQQREEGAVVVAEAAVPVPAPPRRAKLLVVSMQEWMRW